MLDKSTCLEDRTMTLRKRGYYSPPPMENVFKRGVRRKDPRSVSMVGKGREDMGGRRSFASFPLLPTRTSMELSLYSAISRPDSKEGIETVLGLCPLQDCHYADFTKALEYALRRHHGEAIIILLNNMLPSYLEKMIHATKVELASTEISNRGPTLLTQLYTTPEADVRNTILGVMASNELASQDKDLWSDVLYQSILGGKTYFDMTISYLPSEVHDEVALKRIISETIRQMNLPLLKTIHDTWPQALSAGCDRYDSHRTYISAACHTGNEEIIHFIGDKIPQESRSIVQTTDSQGWNVLHTLAEKGSRSIIEYLYEWVGPGEQWQKGVEQLHRNRTPALIAHWQEYHDIAHFLRPDRVRDNVKGAL